MFDNPGRLPDSPKAFERKHRDDAATLSSDHVHVAFSDTCTIPSNWRDCLSCRQCKRTLVLYLSQSFKNITESTCRLRDQQKVVLAGCFDGVEEDQAWEVGVEGVQPVPDLHCEAEEADTRVWLHVLGSPGTRKLCVFLTLMCTTLGCHWSMTICWKCMFVLACFQVKSIDI